MRSRSRACQSAVSPPIHIGGYKLADFSHRPFPHFYGFSARCDGLRQKKISPRPCVTNASRNSCEKNFNRRARRIRQHKREIKPGGASVLASRLTYFFCDGKNI